MGGAPHIELAPPQQVGATAHKSSLSLEDAEAVLTVNEIQSLSHAAALLEEDAINGLTNNSRPAHVPDKSPREYVAPLTKFAPLAHTLLLLRRLRQYVHAKPVPYS